MGGSGEDTVRALVRLLMFVAVTWYLVDPKGFEQRWGKWVTWFVRVSLWLYTVLVLGS